MGHFTMIPKRCTKEVATICEIKGHEGHEDDTKELEGTIVAPKGIITGIQHLVYLKSPFEQLAI